MWVKTVINVVAKIKSTKNTIAMKKNVIMNIITIIVVKTLAYVDVVANVDVAVKWFILENIMDAVDLFMNVNVDIVLNIFAIL